MRKTILSLAVAVALIAAGASAQTVYRLYTSLTGSEIIVDQANPTGGQFTTKVLITQGLANAATKTVSTLPTCNTAAKGYLYEVTDASSPTYGGTLTGGSTTLALALCNGSSWVAH